MLRDCLGWRFDDNRFPRPGKAVVKHHRLGLILPRMVVLVRDPRDTLVSFFHHNRDTFTGDAFNHGAVRLYGKALFEGLTDDPGAMIRRFVEVAETRPVSPAFTWRAFYQAALDRGGHIVRYEDLRTDPAAVLGDLFEALAIPVEPGRIAEVTRQHDIGHILAAREKADRGKGRTGDSKTGDGKTGDGKTGDGKTGDSRTGDDKTGDGKAGHHFIRRGKIGGYQDELDTETIALIERNNAALMQRLGYA
ncbi:MAG: sulfotransferase domain-containing protein [Pseudomonadota bacterium]